MNKSLLNFLNQRDKFFRDKICTEKMLLKRRWILFQEFYHVFRCKEKNIVFSLNPNQREDLIWRAVIVVQKMMKSLSSN
jgi:hypothetical protein